MADINLKTEAIDATIPGDAILFGADNQAAAKPSPYPISRVAEVSFSFDDANQANSLAHMSGWAVGDVVRVKHWDASRQDGSSMLWRAWQAGSGTIGSISNGGSQNGIQMQGNGVRWLAVPTAGNLIDIRAFGIVCDGVATGQETRFEALRAAAQARGLTLTGAGVLKFTKTVDLQFCNVDFSNLLIQFGTPVTATTSPATGDFYTAAGTNIQIASISRANPGVIETVSPHGLAADTMVLLGVSGLGSLVHELSPLTPYYVRNPTSTTFELSLTAGGASIDTTATSVEINLTGTAFAFVPPAAVSGIQTRDIVEWDGRIRRLGVGLIVAGDGSVNSGVRQEVWVRGDGNFDYSTRSTVMAFLLNGDDSPHGRHEFHATYCFVAAGLTGALEKQSFIRLHATYCEHAGFALSDASCDTIDVHIDATKCRHWAWEHDGIPTSINWMGCVEGRDDPGDGSPAFFYRNGKYSSHGFHSRAHNGTRCLLVHKPKQFGVDSFEFKNAHFVHSYGQMIDIAQCRRVSGRYTIKDSLQNGTDTDPCVKIGRVINSGDLVGSIHTAMPIALQVGDIDGLYSREVHFGSHAILCGDNLPISDTNLVVADGSAFPAGKTALDMRRASGCSITLTQCIGDIVVGAQALKSNGVLCRIEVPETQKRYARTVDGAAEVEIGYRMLVAPGGKVPLTLLPQNVVQGAGISVTYNPVTGQSTIAYTGESGSTAPGWNELVLSSDFTTESTTQVAVTGFKFTPAANKRYIVEAWLLHTANANATGVRPGVTMPSGLNAAPVVISAGNGSGSVQANNNTVSSGNTASTAANSAGAVPTMSHVRAMVFAGGSPGGDVQITAASETGTGNPVTILAGSILRWRDIG